MAGNYEVIDMFEFNAFSFFIGCITVGFAFAFWSSYRCLVAAAEEKDGEESWITKAQEGNKIYKGILAEKYPLGMEFDFMTVRYCVVNHIGNGLTREGGIMCSYTNKSGEAKEKFFNNGILCIVDACINNYKLPN
jgi:hypothetical protein